ncbi:MAG: hypothetical protein A2W08_04875 [Candidatus Rokubacteria bacterium RBG_16_73_20]|nr:MAG: hypothetical protein A2050_07205 [Candidatus Rokubacteria bacterium GWA2_73_35]OGK90736.1 MAG: hypothetical protein A2W08_04875 [Candidatus Rokubacteria bacterium RBG_16_73_20]
MSLALGGLATALLLGAGPSGAVRVDDWESRQAGPLDLGGAWRTYPFYERPAFKQPPAIVVDDGRHALRLTTDNESARLGRALKVDLRRTPRLVWEWKPLVLPEGGDVRDRRRNDQAARVMVVFEGMKGIAYVWDTTAPVGAETQPDLFEIFQRVLIVVRSGPAGVGRWHRQTRDVAEDYRRVFGDEPRPTNFVGLEAHSNDTRSRSAALFGAVYFEPR